MMPSPCFNGMDPEMKKKFDEMFEHSTMTVDDIGKQFDHEERMEVFRRRREQFKEIKP